MKTKRLIKALTVALAMSGPAAAEGWSNLYEPTRPVVSLVPLQGVPAFGGGDRADPCLAAIRAAEERHGIPQNLLAAIGFQEAGRTFDNTYMIWPWSVNAAGQGFQRDTREAAIDLVTRLQREGVRSIDIGCMQINQQWHPDAFANIEAAFEPAANVEYAARFLTALRAETGTWRAAAAAYHSRTPERGAAYLRQLDRHLARLSGQEQGSQRFAVSQGPSDALPSISQAMADPDRDIEIAAAAPAEPQPRARHRTIGWLTATRPSGETGRSAPQGHSLFGQRSAKPLSPAIRPLF